MKEERSGHPCLVDSGQLEVPEDKSLPLIHKINVIWKVLLSKSILGPLSSNMVSKQGTSVLWLQSLDSG